MNTSSGKEGVVDVHAHLIPLQHILQTSIDGVRCANNEMLEVDGSTIKLKALFRPDKLVSWMGEQGIDVALVSVPPPVYRQHLDATASAAWTGCLNDGLLEIAAQYPNRLKLLAHLPLEHPQLAVEEAARRQGAHYAGFALAAGGSARLNYADPVHRPLWQSLHDGNAFVFLHPGHCCDERLHSFYGKNLLGNPYETAVAVSHLVFAGIVEEFQNIRFCLAHCGGVVPAVAGRWQWGFETERPGLDKRREPPARSLRRFYADCIAHHPGLIDLATQVFGEDRILFGSDWPFPMGIVNPKRQLENLDERVRDSILRRNYYGLTEDG